MSPHTPSSGEDGFSILETIVAITILALVLGIASQSIVMASRSIAVAKAQVEDARTVRALLADYQASKRLQAADPARRGWTVEAHRIDMSRGGITAITIQKTGASGAARGEPFLTFVPALDLGSQ